MYYNSKFETLVAFDGLCVFIRSGLWWLGFGLLHTAVQGEDKEESHKCRVLWFGPVQQVTYLYVKLGVRGRLHCFSLGLIGFAASLFRAFHKKQFYHIFFYSTLKFCLCLKIQKIVPFIKLPIFQKTDFMIK